MTAQDPENGGRRGTLDEIGEVVQELANRYEEINLLYTIGEILGRTVSVREATATILTELAETVGAGRASILVHDAATGTLQVIATRGFRGEDAAPIPVDDPTSLLARVFRTQQAVIADAESAPVPLDAPHQRGGLMSVPIMLTGPHGGEPLGVVNLSDRPSGEPFSTGDQKLVAAIATQIGTAIQNARLVRASVAQQQLVQEMELAHDLQMKLLPDGHVVAPDAMVAARVVPADSVGGDFYNLFRLGRGRTGVLIGDVSSHGYRAALIMALAMSASAIHAQTATDPGKVLSALLATLREELTSTEMYISVFYGVVNRRRGILRYANTGHPHAFVVTGDGTADRLTALDPPLGLVPESPAARSRRWNVDTDLLLLFTDGLTDARNADGVSLGERRVLETVVAHRSEAPTDIVDRVFEAVRQHTGDVRALDDQAVVVLRT